MTTVLVRWAEAATPAGSAALLGEDEARRWHALRRREDQEMFLAAHVLARWTISEHQGVPVGDVDLVQRCERCAGPHGRPTSVVAGKAGPCISFSHAGGYVIAAVADRPVGVDLEPVAQDRLDVAAVALSPDEQSELETVAVTERGAALIRWWVRKEAVLKATGAGLWMEPKALRVTPPWESPSVVGPAPIAQLLDLSLHPELAATVALVGTEPVEAEISRRRW